MGRARNDVRAVIEYLSSLWGVASGLSVLFPLSNALLQAVPSDVFVKVQPNTALTPALLTTLATVSSLFTILLIISMRRDIASSKSFHETLRRMRIGAVIAFVMAIIVLLFYTSVAEAFGRRYDTTSATERGQAELIGFFGYPLIFAAFTATFTLLGLREYLQEEDDARREREGIGEHARS